MRAWHTGNVTYDTVLACAIALTVVVLFVSPFVASPYGRFASDKFGVSVSPRLGWWLMELPASLVFIGVYLAGPRRADLVPMIFCAVWLVHYGNRGWVFPFLIRSPKGAKASFSWLIIASGWFATSMHAYLHAARFTSVGPAYTDAWLRDPRFVGGLTLYAVSLAANIHADAIIRNLRTVDEVERGIKVYRIPNGGLFRWVTSASYLTELCAWAGFAIATWSLAGAFVFTVSVANLVPRAIATHRWYREKFADYPPERRALVPFVW